MPVVVQSGATASALLATGAVSVNKPAGTAEGDLLLANVATDNGSAGVTYTPPAGWTLRDSNTTGINNSKVFSYWKIAGPSEPATYGWTPSAASNTYIEVARVTGHNATDPIGASGLQPFTGSVTTATLPSVTAPKSGGGLVQLVGSGHGSASWTPPSGTTEVFDVTGAGSQAGGYDTNANAAGATGERIWTINQSANTYGSIWAINPAITSTVRIQSQESFSQAAATSITINKPTGTVETDLLCATFYTDGNTTLTAPAGWTAGAVAFTGGSTRTTTFWKVAGASEPASYTFNASGTATNLIGTVARVTGHDSANPIADTKAVIGAAGSSVTIPSATAANAGTGLIQMVIAGHAGPSWTPPSGAVERYDASTNNAFQGTAGGDEAVNAGTTGDRVWTTTGGNGVSGSMFAVNPAVTGTPTTVKVESGSAFGGLAQASAPLSKPAGTVQGDLLVAFLQENSGVTWTAPAGWTPFSGNAPNGENAWWKIAGASEPASYTWTPNVATTIRSVMVRITGHDSTTPIGAAAFKDFVSDGGTAPIVMPSVSATASGQALINMLVSSVVTTFAPPTGMTEAYENNGLGAGASAGAGYEGVPSGATGTRTWTKNDNTGGSSAGVAFIVNPGVAASSSPGKVRIVYHATNTFTMPFGVPGNKVKVQCEGPGGPGGAGNTTNRGGGGGGGAFAEEPALVLTPGNTYAVTPGQADAPGGAAPVASTFGPTGSPLVRAAAGSPGGNASGITDGSAGAGGTVAGSIGTTKTAGSPGTTNEDGGAGAAPLGGAGGTSGANINGKDYGGGGGGGAILSGAGGTSGRGVVIVEFEYASDAVMASDSRQLIVNFKRSINESVAATDAIAKLVLKRPTDSVTASDTVVKRATLNRTESVAVSDAVVKAVRLLRTETVVTADTITKVLRLLRTENVTASDTFTKLLRKTPSDTVVTSDTIAKVLRKPVAENVTVTDSVLIVLVALRYFSDAAVASDTISKRFNLSKADSVAVLETSFRLFYKNVIGDSVTVTDARTIRATYNRAFADSAVALDSLSKTIRLSFSDNISGSAPPPTTGSRRLFVVNSD